MGCKLRSPVRWAAHNCCLSWLLGNLFSERWNNFCRCKQKAKWNKYIFKSRLYIQYIYLISIKCSFLNAEYHLDLQLKKESNKCCWLVPQMYNRYACMCNTWTTCHRMQECTEFAGNFVLRLAGVQLTWKLNALTSVSIDIMFSI